MYMVMLMVHDNTYYVYWQVVGVPDKRLGEEICAWIELKDNETATEDEIKAFCKAKVCGGILYRWNMDYTHTRIKPI